MGDHALGHVAQEPLRRLTVALSLAPHDEQGRRCRQFDEGRVGLASQHTGEHRDVGVADDLAQRLDQPGAHVALDLGTDRAFDVRREGPRRHGEQGRADVSGMLGGPC